MRNLFNTEYELIHGDIGHSCFNDEGEMTCVMNKILLSGVGPSWREVYNVNSPWKGNSED